MGIFSRSAEFFETREKSNVVGEVCATVWARDITLQALLLYSDDVLTTYEVAEFECEEGRDPFFPRPLISAH